MTTKLTDPSHRTIEFTRGADGDVHVLSRHSAGHVVLIGPLNPAEVRRALDAECPAEATPAPISKPTRQDFVWAKFAVHPEGAWAARLEEDHLPWIATEGAGMDHTLSDAAMADGGWQIVTPAPTTVQGCLDLLVSLCHEPEGDWVPRGTGLVTVEDNGRVVVRPGGFSHLVSSRGDGFRRLLIDPPAPERPEWADLADAIKDATHHPEPDDLARVLHEHGVRVES